jgi:hypothetical protein
MNGRKTTQTPVSATQSQADQPAPTQPDRPPDLSAAGNLAVQQWVKNIQAQIAPDPFTGAPASGPPAPATPQPVSIHWSESSPWLFTVDDDPAPSAISLELYGIDITPSLPLEHLFGSVYVAEPELLRPEYRERLHQQVQSQLHDDVEELENLIFNDFFLGIPRGMEIIRRWASRGDIRAPSGRTYFDVFLGRLRDEYWYRDYLFTTGAKHTFYDSMFEWARAQAVEISILIGKNSLEFGAYRPEWAKVERAIQPGRQGNGAKPSAAPEVVNAELVTRTTDLILERLKGITFAKESHEIADLLINLPPPEQSAVLDQLKSRYDDRELFGLVGKYGEASGTGMIYWLFEDLESAPFFLERMPKTPEVASLMLQFDRERLAQSLVTNGVLTQEEAGMYVAGRGFISRTLPWTTGKVSELAEERAKYWADKANRGDKMAYFWGSLDSLFDRQHIDFTILTIAGPKLFEGLGSLSPKAAPVVGGVFAVETAIHVGVTAKNLIFNWNQMSGAERLSSILDLASNALFFAAGRMARKASTSGRDPRLLPSGTAPENAPGGSGGLGPEIGGPPAIRPPGLPGAASPGGPRIEWRIFNVNEKTGDITAVGRLGNDYGFIQINIITGDGQAIHPATGQVTPIRGGAFVGPEAQVTGTVEPPSPTPAAQPGLPTGTPMGYFQVLETAEMKVTAENAAAIADRVARGESGLDPAFKGKVGGATFLVSKGDPYTGVTPEQNVSVQVSVKVPANALVFDDAALVNIQVEELAKLFEEQGATLPANFRDSLRVYIQTKPRDVSKFTQHTAAGLGLSNNKFKSLLGPAAIRKAEAAMWERVGLSVVNSGVGVGRVVYRPGSPYSWTPGEFLVVRNPGDVYVVGGDAAYQAALAAAKKKAGGGSEGGGTPATPAP